MARMRAGMERERQMINAPHVNRVQRENTEAQYSYACPVHVLTCMGMQNHH